MSNLRISYAERCSMILSKIDDSRPESIRCPCASMVSLADISEIVLVRGGDRVARSVRRGARGATGARPCEGCERCKVLGGVRRLRCDAGGGAALYVRSETVVRVLA